MALKILALEGFKNRVCIFVKNMTLKPFRDLTLTLSPKFYLLVSLRILSLETNSYSSRSIELIFLLLMTKDFQKCLCLKIGEDLC